ncbi:MAG: hypothetical protein IPP53_05965 [Bacteroidetes bacterium]|nr:hypothetical protein [Bacteroidota bacterium]
MKKIHYLFYFCLLFSCKHDVLNKKETPFDDLEKLEESGNIASLSNVKISNDFENWLITNGYSNYNFTRNDISGGSFGGKKNASQLIKTARNFYSWQWRQGNRNYFWPKWMD